MLIGIISDTHDNVENTKKAVDYLNKKGVKKVIHLGDWSSPGFADFFNNLKRNFKTISLYGNNDGDIYRFTQYKKKYNWDTEFFSDAVELSIDNKKIVAYHGDSRIITDALIKCKKYDLVLSGHIHVAINEKHGNVLHLNPGSLSGLKEGRCDNPITFALYDTELHEGEIINL